MSESAPVARLKALWRNASPLARACVGRLESSRHGDLPRWLAAFAGLPVVDGATIETGPVVTVAAPDAIGASQRQALRATLEGLRPWRKGPFDLFGVRVDAEWRSDMKWERVCPHVALAGRRVLDVGSGNGYYGWRMLDAGAASVVGIDPSILFGLQHAAIALQVPELAARNLVLPLALEDLASAELPPVGPFDVLFSMGVVYHRRDPAAHVAALARLAAPGATLVLESLVADAAFVPAERYARMRNVWFVPDADTIDRWLAAAGFGPGTVVDVTTTTAAEQRSTEWMPHQSLADALDPADPARTIEGYPAPKRAVIVATAS